MVEGWELPRPTSSGPRISLAPAVTRAELRRIEPLDCSMSLREHGAAR